MQITSHPLTIKLITLGLTEPGPHSVYLCNDIMKYHTGKFITPDPWHFSVQVNVDVQVIQSTSTIHLGYSLDLLITHFYLYLTFPN